MAKYRVLKEAIAPYDGAKARQHFYPGSPDGDVVDLDENDPRVTIWLDLGIIEKVGGRPKAKEEGE